MPERIGTCDSCGRLRPIVRTFDKVHYCTVCYKQQFTRITCTRCGSAFRVPKDHPARPLLCHRCATANRTCIRCGKLTPRAALLTEQGAVCSSCLKYFKAPQPCAYCGVESRHLSRDFRLGLTEPACPSCRARDYRTCSSCGKYRRVHTLTANAHPLCARCAQEPIFEWRCPRCGNPGKRHSKTCCQACYHADLAQRKLEVSLPLLSRAWTRDAFTRFFAELRQKRGDLAAIAAHERHFLFFSKLDAAFPDPHLIDADNLLQAVELKTLRIYDLPLNFLCREGLIADVRRSTILQSGHTAAQQRILDRAKDHWYAALLGKYYQRLTERQARQRQRGWIGKHVRFVPRTVTNYLRTAAKFLAWLETHEIQATQAIRADLLDAFLFECPGQADGLRSFVRYLNTHEILFCKLRIPTRIKNLPENALLSDHKYQALLAQWLSPTDDQLLDAMVGLMMTLYCQTLKKTVALQLSQFEHNGDDILVRLGAVPMPLAPPVAAVLTRYLAHRQSQSTMLRDTPNPYLFPGRNLDAPITADAVTRRIRKYGVNADQLFSTGLYQAYLGGVRHPKTLVTRFGISLITAMKYFELLSPRFRAENERISKQ